MPRLTIDDIEIEVPHGTKVIDAAERLGIMIPRFCYHRGLGSVGACRMCAVKFLQGPFKGLQMSCMIDAQDGMVISTTDAEALDFRRHVIEWLMLNHPHDCPVCDEGGHCLLQDMTVSGGHGMRRFSGEKRTYRDQYLGELVQHEMNRCIHCYRCVRFYREFAGYRDLGALQIAQKVYFGRLADGPLESPFAGNLVDLCPTGVYTDKPARFRARRWDLERGPSLCIHCSLGCNTVAGARYREVLRQEARLNEEVNGYFICDLGRYGFAYAGHPERPRSPRIGSQAVGWQEAVAVACDRLARLGPRSIACLSSARASVETLGTLKYLSKRVGSDHFVCFYDAAVKFKMGEIVSKLDGRTAVSLRDIEKADLLIGVGADPINAAPMLALAMRQAQRAGAKVVMMDPRPLFLPCDFEHLSVSPELFDVCLSALVKSTFDRERVGKHGEAAVTLYDRMLSCDPLDASVQARLEPLIAVVEGCRRPIIICGSDIAPASSVSFAADVALLMGEVKDQSGVFYVLPGANAYGAALFDAANGSSFESVVQEIEDGAIKALIVAESDPFRYVADRDRLQRALNKLELLLVLDYLPSETVRKAHIFLPTRAIFETRSSFINQEGRLQVAEKIHSPGTPIWQVSNKGHPPRLYGTGICGGEPRAAWRVLQQIAHTLVHSQDEISENDPWPVIGGECAVLARHHQHNGPLHGLRIIPQTSTAAFFDGDLDLQPKQPMDGHLTLLPVVSTFATEELASYSEIIQRVIGSPCAYLHSDDAERCGLLDCDRIRIAVDDGFLEIDLTVSDKMARGFLILPRHSRFEWQKLHCFAQGLPVEKIGNCTP